MGSPVVVQTTLSFAPVVHQPRLLRCGQKTAWSLAVDANAGYRRGMSSAVNPVGRPAAFFDLDKTILARSSSFAFARPFYREGLIGRSDVIRSAYAQFIYLASGADHQQMESMREYMSNLVTGWDVDKVQAIVNETLDEIVDPIVFDEAFELIEQHKAAGRDVIIISSSGTDIVEPIGTRLGADLSIGTQVAIEDGRYTGEIMFYAYGEGKAQAMRELATERGYDLSHSYAYSDSYTDLPMLAAVGYPTAVNPDSELRKVAHERGWPIRDFAKPVALKARQARRTAVAASAGVALAGVALGITWYARRRMLRGA